LIGGGAMKLDIIKVEGLRDPIFKNVERVDEELIYNEAIQRMKNLPNAEFVDTIKAPDGDFSFWKLNGRKVTFKLDLYDGAVIYTESDNATDDLIKHISG
jgi:hypothetical protein